MLDCAVEGFARLYAETRRTPDYLAVDRVISEPVSAEISLLNREDAGNLHDFQRWLPNTFLATTCFRGTSNHEGNLGNREFMAA